MNVILRTTLIGLSVGIIGTGMGGIMAFILNRPSKKFLSGVIGISSGLMVAIVTFELLPEAFALGSVWGTAAGVCIGTMGAAYLDGFVSKIQFKNRGKHAAYIKTSVLLGIGIALHNFPEGLAIGSGFVAQERLGIGLAVVIALHNMPEGIAMVTPLRVAGYSKLKAFSLTLLAGAPMGLGAYLGALIGSVAYEFIGICLAFAGGTMLYITFGELIPRSKSLNQGRFSTVFSVFGFILGMIVSKTF
ncbi:ZIP family metal transporter [Serpentinicella sp. ANB-PHB4]|uniref:ZIP family metal transporter n=1 Tax=Serpentinicella sp. ANB-PHB4 TaxID=3074076 RepID=UPI00286114CE|nr:ZIP family metal transporter [Serpentinicella sp. ANB-PHB4]MDR5659729.1 ZIP family metal transporter [Serpentinicella sp. ANB-PHB4]